MPQSTADTELPSFQGTSHRGDTLQEYEEITLHDTTMDHTHLTLGMQGGDHMLTMSLLLVVTLMTPWTLCNIIFGQLVNIWNVFENNHNHELCCN